MTSAATQVRTSLISLSQIYDHDSDYNKIAKKATEALRRAVFQEYSGDKKISLRLFSETDKAGSLFYPSQNSDICGQSFKYSPLGGRVYPGTAGPARDPELVSISA